jgi:tetratricopeptide (TPR) repeat protein
MKQIKYVILVLFVNVALFSHAQNNPPIGKQQNFYEDRITDEFGIPIEGVKVLVRGKGHQTYSDADGYFRVKASRGDFIVLSKNGKNIGSYRLDGSLEYRVNAKDFYENEKTEKEKVEKKRRSFSLLDSALYYQTNSPYKSIDFVTEFLGSRKKISEKNLAKSYHLLAENYLHLKQYDLAISNYNKSLQSEENTTVRIQLAKALSLNTQFDASTNTYLELDLPNLSSWQKVIVTEGLATNFEKKQKEAKALKYYKQALQLARKHHITPKIATINAKIAGLESKKDSNAANDYLQEALKEVNSEHLTKRTEVQNTIADIYQSNKDYDNEILVRTKTLNELEADNNESEISNSEITKSKLNLEIGRAYIDKNEYDKAIPYLEKSANVAEKQNNLEVQKKALQKLSELYKKTGRSKKALQNYQEYAKIVDKLYQKKEDEIQAAVRLSKELQAKQNRINSLEKDRELTESRFQLSKKDQELKTSNYKKQQLIIYGLILGLLLLGISLFFMYRNNKQKRFANNLLALKSLRSQMNPHFIFNALNSVNSFIAQNDERAANRYLTDFSKLMRNVLNNSEEDFIPLEKEIELLQLYIKLEHSRFEDKFDYEINVAENVEIKKFQIPPMLLQPYVENAVWHGLRYKKTKGKLEINISQIDPQTLKINISDDGIGREKSKTLKTQNQKKQQSKGMGNIKKRVQILNEMYTDKVDVSISNLLEDQSGTKVELLIKRD